MLFMIKYKAEYLIVDIFIVPFSASKTLQPSAPSTRSRQSSNLVHSHHQPVGFSRLHRRSPGWIQSVGEPVSISICELQSRFILDYLKCSEILSVCYFCLELVLSLRILVSQDCGCVF